MAAPSSTRFGHPFTFLQLPFPSSLIKIHQFVIPRPLHGYAAAIQIPELLKVEVGGGGGEGEQKRGRPGSVQHPGVRRWDEPGYCSVAASRGAAGAVIVAAHEEIFGGENILHGVLPAPGERAEVTWRFPHQWVILTSSVEQPLPFHSSLLRPKHLPCATAA